LRLLKNACEFDEYDLVECGYGLKLLQQQDLSEQLISLQCKKIFIHGGRDAVVNMQAAQNAAVTSNAQFCLVPNAGHAPHISHPNVVAELIKTHLC
jgi:pimeloyl-ACP methyl ester carboxylesterase